MSLDVYINDKLIDLKNDKGIGLTFQVGSIFNPGGRAGNLSNKFSVPKTRNNTEILGNLSNINSTFNIPYERNSAKIIQDGIEIFPDGFALVDSTSSTYSITIYSGNVSFFDLIKGSNINELDWTSSDHIYDITTISNSFTNNSDYIYPIIEFGSERTLANGTETFFDLLDNTNLQFADVLLPCARGLAVLNKIVESVGYELKGTFKDSDEASRLVITPNNLGTSEAVAERNAAAAYNITPIPLTNIQVPDNSIVTTPIINYPFFEYNSSFGNDAITLYPTAPSVIYTPTETISGIIRFVIHYYKQRNYGGSVSNEYRFRILEDGVEIAFDSVVQLGSYGFPTQLTFDTGVVTLDSTKEYTCDMVIILGRTSVAYDINYRVTYSEIKITPVKNVSYGGSINFGSMFNWNQGDFFKDIMNQYSLTMQTDEIKKQLFLSPLDDLENNLFKAKNWTEKINTISTPSVKYKLSGYNQRNYFNYGEEETVPVDFGQGYIDINDESLGIEGDKVQLKSVASISTIAVVNNVCPRVALIPGPGNTFENKKLRHLILDVTTSELYLKNSVTPEVGGPFTTVPYCYFIKSGRKDSLDFPSLIDANYNSLKGMTKQTKVISAGFRLTEVDISNLDFSIPIYLNVQNSEISIDGYFYINKISNFKKNATTKVELIRL